ncbi:MAG: arginine deiminase-related protein [Tissierellia bacterium]|nr:arginine deiminase-related protein [Tissierellia bacterium]
MMKQTTNEIIMIKPHAFKFNFETAVNNVYQKNLNEGEEIIQKKASEEFENMVEMLKKRGVKVNVLEDFETPETPDSIFPNNWFSTEVQHLVIYPMFAENRRAEVGKFFESVKNLNEDKEVLDFRGEGILEGTGSMVLDRVNRVAYASISARTEEALFEKFCEILGYEKITFTSYQDEMPIYHTNVMMSIGTELAFLAYELIEEKSRDYVYEKLNQSHEVIKLNSEEVKAFGGNLLELEGENGRFLLMSKTAYEMFSREKIEKIEEYLDILSVDVSTIENYGGGSVRCMVAEIF